MAIQFVAYVFIHRNKFCYQQGHRTKASSDCRRTTMCSTSMGCMSLKRRCCLLPLGAYTKLWNCKGSTSTCSKVTCCAMMAPRPAHLLEMGDLCFSLFQMALYSFSHGRQRYVVKMSGGTDLNAGYVLVSVLHIAKSMTPPSRLNNIPTMLHAGCIYCPSFVWYACFLIMPPWLKLPSLSCSSDQ